MIRIKNFLPQFSAIIYVIIICAFFKAIAYWALTPYLPMYLGSTIGLGTENSGYLIGIGSLSGTFISIFCGYLIDRYNKRIIFIISLIIMAAGYLCFGFISNILFIMALLMIINIASSSLAITSNAWISILLSDEESAKAFSIKYILENIGAMIGPVLGTFFIATDPRFPFFIAAVSLCITIIVFGIYSKPLLKDIKNEKAIPSEGVKKTFSLLISDKSLLFFTIGGIFSMMIYGALVTFMSLFFSVTYSYEVAYQKVAYISVLNAVIVLSIQYFVSAVIKKDTIMKWIRFAIISMIIGLMILMYNTNFIFMTVAILLLSFGEVVIVPAEYLFIIKITPENKRGLYLGAQNLIYLGLSFSPIICGFMLEKFAPQWMLLSLVALLGLSLFFYSLGYVKSEKFQQIDLKNSETTIN